MYRIILMGNGDYKKTLHRCKTRDTAFINYRKLKLENEQVLFPRKFINSHGIQPIDYEIFIVKDYELNDKMRIRRSKLGKTYEEKPLFGIWTALDSSDFNIEETFWLYGKESNDRITITDILDMLRVVDNQKDVKQLIIVHNKLIIHSNTIFEMIICKCKKDAQRLHHELQKLYIKYEISGCLFMGTATPATVSRMYEIIKENTDWLIEKIRRTSTRP